MKFKVGDIITYPGAPQYIDRITEVNEELEEYSIQDIAKGPEYGLFRASRGNIDYDAVLYVEPNDVLKGLL